MVALDAATVAELAKKHLGLPSSTPDERVPRFYRDDLSRHLMLYPKEDNFRVTLQPKSGFGTVTCLKDGCNEVIQLEAYVRRVRNPDGGKSVGFGSLAAYRSHIMSAHGRRRAGGSAAASHEDTASQSSTSQASVKSTTATRGTAARKSAPNPNTARIKAEQVEPSIPRKRVSDTAFNAGRDEEKVALSSDPSPPKKAKTEAADKTPFQPVTNTVMFAHPSSSTILYPNEAAEDIRAKTESVQMSLYGHQNMMNDILHQPTMSSDDARRVSYYDYDTEIRHWRAMEGPLNVASSTLPSGFYATQNGSYDVGQEYGNHFPSMPSLTFQQGRPQPQPSPMDSGCLRVKAEPYQMSMDVDRPRIKAEPLPMPMDVDYYRPKAEPFPMFDRKPIKPIPFRYKQPSPVLKDVKAVVHHANAVASSSRPLPVVAAKLPPALSPPPVLPGTYSDSGDEDGYDSNGEYGIGDERLAAPYIGQIGIDFAPIRDENRDDNGDYYGRGKDLYVGPQAKSDDLEKFLVEAGNAEAFDGNATVDKAVEYLGLRGQHDRIPGMEVTLMAHQLMGVAWMVEKESSGFNGGCLADEMGLGKTIQMMTVMVKNRSRNPNRKTNLIVAPLALLNQWKQEIEEKTSCGLRCYIYHGNSRARKKSELMKYDVVLTTFATMASEWPDFENEMKKKAKAKKRGDTFIVNDSDEEDMRHSSYRNEKRKKKSGLLFQVDWYRVITDEAQSLRNRRTRVSRASSDLMAIYRWCLTGTPIVNTLADAYGYIRFLQIRPWYDWSKFQADVGCHEKKNPALAVTRLQKITTSFLLRRKKDTQLDGKRLIELPEKKVDLIKLEFSPEEREIYKMVEAKNQATFNRYLRAGTVLKNYHQVLVLVLRLRQICSHPSLIQEGENAFLHPEEYGDDVRPEFATELTRARRLVSNEFVTKLKEKFKVVALERMEAEKNTMDATLEAEDDECPICYDAMTDAVVTPCAHIFCRDCIVDVLNRAPGNEDAQRTCPVCRDPVFADKLFARAAFEPTDKELNPVAEEGDDIEMIDVDAEIVVDRKGKGKPKSKKSARPTHRKVINLDDEGDYIGSGSDDMSDFIVESDEDEEEKDARRAVKRRTGKKRANIILDSEDELEEPEVKEVLFGVRKKVHVSPEAIKLMPRFLPSTKMKYMMEQLVKLAKAKPEEKTLIVSQWTGCLALVSDYLTENGIVHVKYQGDMNRTKRDQAVQVFMSREKARVMLMSTKCGGVGLNLTRANNVISLDLCWSQAIEAQCFDRVHRLGQLRPVRVQRVVIADTVEDRILTLQDRKQALADGTLGEGSGKKIGRLSVKELANLFGLDARGRVLK